MLKLEVCGKSGCLYRMKYLKVIKLSDTNREKFAKEKMTKFKDKSAVDKMDADEIMDSLALLKDQAKEKKRDCKRGSCEVKDKTGKTVDKKEVDAKNKVRAEKAAKLKKEWEAKEAQAKKEGKTIAKLSCPTGKDETGAKVECSGMGICTMGKSSGKGRCACDYGFTGRACQQSESEREEMKTAQKNAMAKMAADAKKGKIQSHKGQKDFLKSVLADNDDEVDIDEDVADALVESQKNYAAELKAKFRRKKEGKADSTDADFEAPSKEELDEMMQQTLKLRKQRALAKQAKKDREEFDKNDTAAVNGTAAAVNPKALTKAEREALRAEKKAARAARKEEQQMMKDLQAVQGSALLDEMTKGGKKTAVAEQSYGETYMKTTVLDADSIGDQMYADASGEKKMRIGKGASATEKPADAVSDTPAGTTKPAASTDAAAATTRLLQDANATAATPAPAGNATAAAAPVNNDWKKLKGEDEYMRVVVNEKMFSAGPLKGIKKPIIMFNKHGADYVKDFPRGKRGSYDRTTGKKINQTAAVSTLAAAAGVNVTGATVEEGDDELEDTVAQQVMELEFINGETMEDIKIANLTKGMLKICMMMKDNKQRVQYMNEENDQMQDDGISENSMTQISTRDDTNQRERKGYEMCVDLTHATTFATIDGEASSSLYSYSMMVLMALLAVLFFKQE